ncbi:DUF1697 domain-containing protein [Blastococcus xanthinilyticus]|uniref:Uncharacterized protein (DUF1697 family) n=1 Tax=Blastococcus xanthinilyticus TaxID=1564164 RepID=A0A5S5CUT1_9ACTN|nr:DUF1697 domain-containing protein [Blastococcus xanthinilyticus]TYP87561.1 uncharacterized protein (DUF1697 family) [Blastococcus xanthinilyticus]
MTTRYVALLRAINLGATRRVPMPRLREALTARGFGAVRTHLGSGNVLLDSLLPEAELAAELTRAIDDEFAIDVPVVVRTADELADVVAADPLGHVATNPARYSVTFYAEPLDPERVAALPPADGWEYVPRGREVYIWLPDGLQSDRRTERAWTQLLGVGTNRNWNTVRKLAELTR